MKRTLLLFSLIGTVLFASAQLSPEQPAPLGMHLLEVNAEWRVMDEPTANDPRTVTFASDAERIAHHLHLVRAHLAKHVPEGLAAEQLSARQELLNDLEIYADRGLFPQNRVLPVRNPVFIDNLGTACAVGQLMIESGHADLAERIHADLNLGYVREILSDPRFTAAVSTWAVEHGFTAAELAWIQPAYAPPVEWTPLGSGTNGDVRVIHDLGEGALLVAGSFTEAGGVAASSVAIWENGQYTTLGDGVAGDVSCVVEHGGLLYLGGQFYGGSQDLAAWNGTTWSYEAVFASKSARITALHVHEGELFAAGELIGFVGPDHGVMRKLGSTWEQVGALFNGEVLALGSHDGALVAGGSFTGPDGQTDPVYPYVAILENMNWVALGNGLNATVRTLLDVDGTLHAGGELFVNVVITFGLARLPEGTSTWEELLPDHGSYMVPGLGANYIGSLARMGNGLIVGGQFVVAEVVGVYGTNVARWNGGPDQIEPLAGYLDGAVLALHVQDSAIVMGGAFQTPLPHVASTDLSTGIREDGEELSLLMYPNPTDDMLRILLPDGAARSGVTVYDTQGRIVPVAIRSGTSSMDLDVSALSSGTYNVQVDLPSGPRTASFIRP
ncbi:MAG TPA: T9SS type A sorting domain-containing protein [Flavobacteriales bacterium]|jgi:hypothetical protein|nr:T9SS type A sorting domain-containing protein [Flavobacteriales bacterium]